MYPTIEKRYAVREGGGWCEVDVLHGTSCIVSSKAVSCVLSGDPAFDAWFRETYGITHVVATRKDAIVKSAIRRSRRNAA